MGLDRLGWIRVYDDERNLVLTERNGTVFNPVMQNTGGFVQQCTDLITNHMVLVTSGRCLHPVKFGVGVWSTEAYCNNSCHFLSCTANHSCLVQQQQHTKKGNSRMTALGRQGRVCFGGWMYGRMDGWMDGAIDMYAENNNSPPPPLASLANVIYIPTF